MKTIQKYPLKPLTELYLPHGAEILTVQMQGNAPHLWVLADPQAPLERRQFHVYGTGTNVPDQPGRYIATFQMLDGQLVWHVFESTKMTYL
jgi:hypothetical protein